MKKEKTALLRLWGPAAAIVATFTALIAGLLLSGAAQARILMDPGAFVRWGLPCVQNIAYVAMAVTVAALAFAIFLLPLYIDKGAAGPRWKHSYPRRKNFKRAGRLMQRSSAASQLSRADRSDTPPAYHPLYVRALNIATVAAVVWAFSSCGVLLLGYVDITGANFNAGQEFTQQLSYFVLNISIGRAWLIVALIAVAVSIICCAARSITVVSFAGLFAAAGIVPLALIGHAAGADDHTGAVNSLGLHLLGMSLWLGGIVVLACLANIMSAEDTKQVIMRFSQLAFFCFLLVVVSGIINAALRIKTVEQIFNNPYGLLVVFKSIASIVLGFIGFLHRRWIIPHLDAKDAAKAVDCPSGGENQRKSKTAQDNSSYSAVRVLWQLIAVELVIMGCVSALAVALSRSAPPTPIKLPDIASVARIISGYELPPRLEPSSLLTQWRFDWLWVFIILCAAVFYVRGMLVLRKRGVSWGVGRTVCWFVGLAALFYITSGAIAVYGHVLFSVHMVDHMALTMIAPFFLVLGAPITLCLKALSSRSDGSRGIREWLLAIVHSRFSAFLTNPVVAAINFAGSLIVFYYTPLFHFAMYTHIGHEWMNVHFLLAGYIFVLTMIGVDPISRRLEYPMRLILLIATMGFHAFFGVGLMMSPGLLLSSWFGNMGRPWGDSAIIDQQTGGAIAWGLGEIPTMVLAVVVAVQWSIADRKEAKRVDRHAERTADAQLNAYNEMLAQLAHRDREDIYK